MDWLDLPEVALIQILNCLTVHEQLNARLVCRHWKLINDSSVRRNEVVIFFETYPRPVYWLHDESEVDLGNAFMVIDFEVLKNEFFLRYFRKVRRLVIGLTVNRPSQEFVELIQSSFRELEHLQFSLIGAGDMPLGLHCPRLTELFVYSELTINETTSEETKLCIQNLRFLLVQKLTYPPDFEFSNLEVLYFNKPSFSIVLNDFPRLKELHYFEGVSGVHDELRDALDALLEQKRRLKRDELKFYFDGFELKDQTEFEILNGYLPSDEDLCALHLNEKVMRLIKEGSSRCKFNLLSKQFLMSDQMDEELAALQKGNALVESMFKSVEYILFEQSLSKQFPNFFDLSHRFRYVFSVNVGIELAQAQLNRLADALPHLVSFTYQPTFFSENILDFEFVGRFKSLRYFWIRRNLLSTSELRSIMSNCKLIDDLLFDRPNEVRVQMFKNSHKEVNKKDFSAIWFSSDGLAFADASFSVEELLDYFEASKWLEKNNFLGERVENEPALLLWRPID